MAARKLIRHLSSLNNEILAMIQVDLLKFTMKMTVATICLKPHFNESITCHSDLLVVRIATEFMNIVNKTRKSIKQGINQSEVTKINLRTRHELSLEDIVIKAWQTTERRCSGAADYKSLRLLMKIKHKKSKVSLT